MVSLRDRALTNQKKGHSVVDSVTVNKLGSEFTIGQNNVHKKASVMKAIGIVV